MGSKYVYWNSILKSLQICYWTETSYSRLCNAIVLPLYVIRPIAWAHSQLWLLLLAHTTQSIIYVTLTNLGFSLNSCGGFIFCIILTSGASMPFILQFSIDTLHKFAFFVFHDEIWRYQALCYDITIMVCLLIWVAKIFPCDIYVVCRW